MSRRLTILDLAGILFLLVSVVLAIPALFGPGKKYPIVEQRHRPSRLQPEDFDAKDLTPSIEVPLAELERIINDGVSDAIGIPSIPIEQRAEFPAEVRSEDPNGPFPVNVSVNGKSVKVEIVQVDGPGPPRIRAVKDNQAFALVTDTCGNGLVQKHDYSGRKIEHLVVKGDSHAHSTALLGRKRNLLFVTVFESPEPLDRLKRPRSLIRVYDWQSMQLINTLRMPVHGENFRKMVLSKDENHLFCVFADYYIRQYDVTAVEQEALK